MINSKAIVIIFSIRKIKMPSNLGVKLNLERKHSQLRFHTWDFHQFQKELQVKHKLLRFGYGSFHGKITTYKELMLKIL